MALAQGSGELIWWPYIVAKYGLAFLFLLVPAALLQFPVCFEIGRYTLLTGEGVFTGFFRLNRYFGLALWVLFILSNLWFGAFASAGGTALAALFPYPADWSHEARSLLFGQCSIIFFTAALLFANRVYVLIEWVMKIVAIVSLLGMVAACFHPAVRDVLAEFLTGLVSPDTAEINRFFATADTQDQDRLLTAITFTGLGGFWTLFYSYWIKEKGAGMAAHTPPMQGLLSSVASIRTGTGSLPEDHPEAPTRLRAWYRYLSVETLIGILGNLATTLMACLLAYALLRPAGRFPEGFEIAVVQADFFAASWGNTGRIIFLFIAGAFLTDTYLATVDCVARIHIDALHSLFPKTKNHDTRRYYYTIVLALAVITSATMFLDQPGPLIILSAVIGFAGTVIYAIALILLNHRKLRNQLPTQLRSGKLSLSAIALAAACYLTLAAAYIFVKFIR